MPKSHVSRRIAMYRDKLTPERTKEDFEKHRPDMLAAQAEATNELAKVEERVKGVLGGEDVGLLDYLKYHNFSRELYRLQRRHGGGNAVKKEADILVAQYKARQCVESVLKKIRFEVFSIEE